MIASSSTIAKTSCPDVLEACDQALQAKKKELAICDAGVNLLHSSINELTEQVDSLREAESTWYHNPWILIGLGIVGGVLLTK